MPLSNLEVREELLRLVHESGLTAPKAADKCGKSYLWLWRRLTGKTAIKVEDYNLIRTTLS